MPLIVEDEAAIADTLVYALQADGHSTEWVTLGSAALEQQRQRPADLVILDIGLPDISGFETCRQLRRFSEVPVMFATPRSTACWAWKSVPTTTWSNRSARAKWRRG
jgi:two-component system catabolic regulation response regulator CreB